MRPARAGRKMGAKGAKKNPPKGGFKLFVSLTPVVLSIVSSAAAAAVAAGIVIPAVSAAATAAVAAATTGITPLEGVVLRARKGFFDNDFTTLKFRIV